MTLREFLQIEIWSKRTTRKIFVGIGITAVAVAVLGLTVYVVGVNWLTKGERDAARVALRDVDTLSAANSLNEEEFLQRNEEIQAKINNADQVAFTLRDRKVSSEVGLCFISWESKRMKLFEQDLVQQGRMKKPVEDSESAIVDEYMRQTCLTVHRELE